MQTSVYGREQTQKKANTENGINNEKLNAFKAEPNCRFVSLKTIIKRRRIKAIKSHRFQSFYFIFTTRMANVDHSQRARAKAV